MNETRIEIDASGKDEKQIGDEIRSRIAEMQPKPKSIWDLKKPSKAMRSVNEGYSWNPLTSFPRNAPCPCNSGKKFKKCHEGNIPIAIKSEDSEKVRRLMKAIKQGA